MKRKILPLVIAATAAGSYAGVASADAPTVYGKVNASLQKIKEDVYGDSNIDTYKLLSNASRIGVKGSVDINDNLKAVYKLEYELYVDANKQGDGGSDFGQRNTYAGLQGGFGTLVFGRSDTPTKMAQGDVDRFNDLTYGDIKNVMAGENRENNIIMYSAPKLADSIDITLAIMPGEQSGYSSPGQKNKDADNGLADHISAAVSYDSDMLYAALAADRDVEHTDVTRLVGEFKGGSFKVGAIVQSAEEHDKGDGIKTGGWAGTDYYTSDIVWIKKQTAYVLNGQFSVSDDVVLKAQYGHAKNEYSDNLVNIKDTKVDQYALGADYKLNKAAKLYAYYAAVDGKNKDVGDDSKDKTFGVGYELKF